MVRIACCALLALVALLGAGAAGAGEIMIGGPSRSRSAAAKTPAQLAQEREAKAAEAWRAQRVEEKLRTMGPHREAEARREVEMEEAARRARGLDIAPAPMPLSQPAAAEACRNVDDGQKKAWKRTGERASAERTVQAMARQACMHRGGPQGLSLQCKPHQEKRRVAVPGNPLKFTVETGPKQWECLATYRCAQGKRVCEPAGAVRQ